MSDKVKILSLAEANAYAEAASVPSDGSLLFGDDTLSVIAEKYRALRPPLTGRAVLAQVDRPFGKRTIAYHMLTSTGVATLLEPGSASVPEVSVGGSRPESPFRALAVRLSWDYQEQEAMKAASQQGGVPDLYSELMMAAMRAIDETANSILWDGLGTGTGALPGLLASPGAKIAAGLAIADGTAATGEQIIAAIMGVVTRIGRDSKSALKPNRIAYNTDSYYYLSTATWSSQAGSKTILDVLKERTPGVTHLHAPELDAPAALGSAPAILVGCYDSMAAFQAVSAPRPLKLTEIDGGLRYSQIVLAKVSGAILAHPAAYACLTNCAG